jgi:hypothetical protein
MKKKYLWFQFIALNTLSALFILFGFTGTLKIGIRDSFFSTFITDTSIFTKPPSERNSFDWAAQKYINLFLNKSSSEFHLANFKVTDTNTISKAQKIALLYSKNGGDGCGVKSDDLALNIHWISENQGHGCCSDHSQVFIALAILNGMHCREVHHNSHTFNEFYDESLNKWIWIDTQFCLMAKDESGQFLSLFEMFQKFKERKIVLWNFFGNNLHIANTIAPDEIFEKINTQENEFEAVHGKTTPEDLVNSSKVYYFRPHEFKVLQITMGNAVFKEDFYNKKYSWVKKEVRQFALLAFHILPSYLIYDPENLKQTRYQKIKTISSLFLAFYTFINLLLLGKLLKSPKSNTLHPLRSAKHT